MSRFQLKLNFVSFTLSSALRYTFVLLIWNYININATYTNFTPSLHLWALFLLKCHTTEHVSYFKRRPENIQREGLVHGEGHFSN